MSSMKYIPMSKIWNFETWSVEMSGLIHALSITVDAITDEQDSDTAENEALYGILCAMLKQKREFDALYSELCSTAVEAERLVDDGRCKE